MDNRNTWIRGVALVVLLVATEYVQAVITSPLVLKNALQEYPIIVVAKVETLYPEKPAVMLTVIEELKGKTPFRKLPVNLKIVSDDVAKKEKHTEILLKRLAPELPIVLFLNPRGKKIVTFGFTNGTWFQLQGTRTGEETAAWGFISCEPYFRQTFKGTTAEFRQTILDGLSGKKEPPAPDLKEKPGYGPEVPAKNSEAKPDGASPRTASTLWAVIPTLGVGGPLAILALLFPSVFGGVLVLFRQWASFFTVVSLISLAFVVRLCFPEWLRGTWLASDGGWWFLLTVLTFGGAVWSWRRYIHWAADPALYPATKRTEVFMLWALLLSCVGMLLVWYYVPEKPPSSLDLDWNLFLVFSAGIAAGTLYTTYRALFGTQKLTPAMPSEGLILFTALFGFMGIAATRWGGESAAGTIAAEQGRIASTGGHQVEFAGKVWDFLAKDGGQVVSGLFVSSALVEDDRVYIASAHPTLKFGNLYCLDRQTGKELWKFDDDGEFKQAYSSPCVADGRLFIGEGWHDDKKCKLYCLDLKNVDEKTKTPKKLWAFETNSQTESSPAAADGKVYFGAGNDGFFCCDAATGKKLWQFPPKPGPRLLRFGAAPVVADKKVFVGTGVDRLAQGDQGETALFCLDADTGKELWRVAVDYPCWGAGVVWDGHVYFGIGNGDIFTDADKPGGALLCMDSKTGKQIWRVNVGNGVLERPAVDQDHVYFSCRDGHCYCLARADGKEKWRTPLDSPVFASPALAACSGCGKTSSVYAVATGGTVACLDPNTGKKQWSIPLEEKRTPFLASSPRVTVLRDKDGDRRRIFFGAGLDNVPNGKAVLFCLEDRLSERK